MFGPGNAKLPLPPMLMFDRITEINDDQGAFKKGSLKAELEIKKNLWFFDCHFKEDPVMPGCLGLDAMWQLVGFYLGWIGNPGKGRALGVGTVKFTGEVLQDVKLVKYEIDMKKIMSPGGTTVGLANGVVLADEKKIYSADNLKVGLFQIMRRVVITGLGVVSCLGNNQEEVHQSLLNSKSGISFAEEYKEHNLKSHVHGKPNIKLEDHIDRKTIRFMGSGSAYNYIAMKEAIKDSGLEEKEVSNFKTGIVMGSGGPSIENVILAADKTRAKTPKLMGPFIVPRTMASTASATLAVPFKIKGTNYTMSSACATSGHCIGNSMELIQMGKQDIIFAGGSEEIHWAMTAMFDAMTALSSKYNETPETASRAYDKTRDGFVIAGGAGVLVLEEYEHAKARGAKIYAELTGYGATSDGYDMVAPSGEGAVRCMKMAMATAKNRIDYINTHGTSTPVGDITELNAVKETFGSNIPKISSTKSLSGHPLGAASVHEAIYCLIMMKNNFIAGSANINEMDEEAKKFPIVAKTETGVTLNTVMSNSFGFGGTNAALIFEKV